MWLLLVRIVCGWIYLPGIIITFLSWLCYVFDRYTMLYTRQLEEKYNERVRVTEQERWWLSHLVRGLIYSTVFGLAYYVFLSGSGVEIENLDSEPTTVTTTTTIVSSLGAQDYVPGSPDILKRQEEETKQR